MIIVRAPMRMSFVGGGTDLHAFYSKYPGRVVSTAIDKFVYMVLNRTPLVPKYSARYSISETVDKISDLKNSRIRAALEDLEVPIGIEIASFAPLPSRTGLGSSSSFSVALLKALSLYQGKQMNKREVAEAASRLEIDLLNEPIGKQDQYAAAFGGFNLIQFNPDGTVTVEPILLDYKKHADFEDHLMLFYTGITRDAASVLTEQKANSGKKFEVLKKMSDSALTFRDTLLKGNFEELGSMLHEGWQLKKTLASNVSNGVIDSLYGGGMKAGAWGGKILGAGGGGCIMFLAPINQKAKIRAAMKQAAGKGKLSGFKEIPVKFVQSGVEVMFNHD